MNKVQCLLVVCLTIAIGQSNAQSTSRDSIMNKKSLQRDSGRINNTNRQGDSMRSKRDMPNKNGQNNRNGQDSGWMNNSNRNVDSMMRNNRNMTNQNRNMNDQNNRNGQDSGWINNSNMNTDSMHSSNKSYQNKNMSGKYDNMNSAVSGLYSDTGMNSPDISNWPEAVRMSVDEITYKYGPADYVNDEEFIWIKKGVWDKICITKKESKHSFPIEHTDNMTTTISYKVPVNKMNDLGRFDGSVTFDRTQGTLSARCDKEANNFLALNLANDIVNGKKTVEQARKAFGDIVKSKMNGANPLYMQKLTFTGATKASDPDINTTGLTKDEVSKGMKKNSKSK